MDTRYVRPFSNVICMNIEPVAYFRSAFSSKFGIPRQSGLVEELRGAVVFEPGYRNRDALRGIEGFEFLWLVWGFSANEGSAGARWSPVVRPPLLGGNAAMGVFATRSPFRPNGLGLSSVKFLSVEECDGALILNVAGADLMDGTPIYDIKPYVAYCDAHPGARSGFVDVNKWESLRVEFPEELSAFFTPQDYAALVKVLALDPRPQYQEQPNRVYGMPFAGHDVRFTVSLDGVLRVVDVQPLG